MFSHPLGIWCGNVALASQNVLMLFMMLSKSSKGAHSAARTSAPLREADDLLAGDPAGC